MARRTRIWIYPYGFSHSAKELRDAIGGMEIKREGSRYVYKAGDTVINWGCAARPRVLAGVPVINAFDAVRVATSKMASYRRLAEKDVQTVQFTTSLHEAQRWGLDGRRILGRDLDRGSQGRGITVYQSGEGIGQHQFYCKYVRKEREFRAHVWNGRVIFEQEKLKKKGVEDAHRYIRSHGRGWCFGFMHLGDNPIPVGTREAAIQAVAALGLDFGAVDLAWSAKSGTTVLEVNTAPGIENSSLEAYATAIKPYRPKRK